MNNLSIAVLDGNLTADPETKQIGQDRTVTNFRVALNHEYGAANTGDGKEFVSYVPVECWNKLAENCGRYLKKGSRVTVTGDIRQDRWKDNDGHSRSQIKVIAQRVRFDSSPRKDEDKKAA
ncbi:MAG: single-stranded DNA-binding protein [Spirochaetales bacterium]|nr:single-stranded DNA-binding protein [Leptospiraceae bacterium]MCP5483564.1 single-stranded DNA-binding protein [Spirochaetales bacterium]MCP5486418.1 single-stranded DNA-binding protein [Spirochaetales bacterium]